MPATPTSERPDSNRGYALFDLDQTLIPWDTQLLFCDFVVKRMPLRRLYLLIFLPMLPFAKIIGTENMKRVFLPLILQRVLAKALPAMCFRQR